MVKDLGNRCDFNAGMKDNKTWNGPKEANI